MKTVYQCDREGWYVGTTTADESPLEPGVYHIPAMAHEEAPPEHPGDGSLWPRHTPAGWTLQSPPTASSVTPAEKLAAFLAAHPDVVALISGASPPVA